MQGSCDTAHCQLVFLARFLARARACLTSSFTTSAFEVLNILRTA